MADAAEKAFARAAKAVSSATRTTVDLAILHASTAAYCSPMIQDAGKAAFGVLAEEAHRGTGCGTEACSRSGKHCRQPPPDRHIAAIWLLRRSREKLSFHLHNTKEGASR